MTDKEKEIPTFDENEPILPDDWDGVTNIFDSGDEEHPFGSDGEPTLEAAMKEDKEESEKETEKPSSKKKESDDGESQKKEDEKTPTTEKKTSGKLRFKAKIDHEEKDIDLDESELPAIYQKSANFDRLQKKYDEERANASAWDDIAELLGYKNAQEMKTAIPENYKKSEVKRLMASGESEEIAKEIVESRMNRKYGNKFDKAKEVVPEKEEQKQERNLKSEIAELRELYPDADLKKLPKEVIEDIISKGERVTVAYKKYLDKQQSEETEKTKKENTILKQNARASQKAPVRGVSGGGDTAKLSDFDKSLFAGFDRDDY